MLCPHEKEKGRREKEPRVYRAHSSFLLQQKALRRRTTGEEEARKEEAWKEGGDRETDTERETQRDRGGEAEGEASDVCEKPISFESDLI